MPKRVTIQQIIFEPPPVTKEEALAPRSSYYEPPDGYDGHGGGEAPSEFDLDRMVYPHDRSSMEIEIDNRQADREAQAEVFREDALRRSRQFDTGEHDAKVNQQGGVLSAYDKGGK